jgi:hypothetical protein
MTNSTIFDPFTYSLLQLLPEPCPLLITKTWANSHNFLVMFRAVRMGYEFIRFPCMDSYAWHQKIRIDLRVDTHGLTPVALIDKAWL